MTHTTGRRATDLVERLVEALTEAHAALGECEEWQDMNDEQLALDEKILTLLARVKGDL